MTHEEFAQANRIITVQHLDKTLYLSYLINGGASEIDGLPPSYWYYPEEDSHGYPIHVGVTRYSLNEIIEIWIEDPTAFDNLDIEPNELGLWTP